MLAIVTVSMGLIILFTTSRMKREITMNFEEHALNLLESTKNLVESQHKNILYYQEALLTRRKIELKNNLTIAMATI